MRDSRIFIDCFSAGLDDLSRRDQGDIAKVLVVLGKTKKFSAFEASDNPTIAGTVTLIFEKKLVRDMGGGYPWTHVELTDEGRKWLTGAQS